MSFLLIENCVNIVASPSDSNSSSDRKKLLRQLLGRPQRKPAPGNRLQSVSISPITEDPPSSSRTVPAFSFANAPRARSMISLPGWCLLSRKHARGILDIPSQLDGMNLWPAFERVWAPEEVFLPTALALSGNIDRVSRRALTYSRWDERAADHRDRAHPLSYDGSFDDELVSRTRAEGCLFLRKMKRSLDLSTWEQIVVRRGKGRDSGSGRSPGSDARGRDRGVEGGWDHGRYGDGCDDPYKRNPSYHSGAGYDSRRGHDSNANRQRRKREPDDHSNRDDYRKRQHWRR